MFNVIGIYGQETQQAIGCSILPDHRIFPLREAIRLDADQLRQVLQRPTQSLPDRPDLLGRQES
jgi:hypothetical protein